MAAFYPDVRRVFYRRWVQRTIVLWLNTAIRVEGEKVIHWMSEILLAAQVTLSRLHRGMPE
jgi:recombinational DNA repair protein RecR